MGTKKKKRSLAKPSKRAKSAKKGKRAPSKKPKRAPSKKPKRTRSKKAAPMFQRIAFTMFSVQDATRARAFYEDVLGLTRGLAAPNGVWTEYDLPGGGCLALFCHPNQASAGAPGGASVAFEVADLDALAQRLTAAGVVFEGGVVKGPHCRMSTIRDSEGNAIILHQLD